MITIAIADIHQIYCQGLKTMLEQVEGFDVVLLSASDLQPEVFTRLCVDILLVDADLYQDCTAGSETMDLGWPATRMIILTMDHDEITPMAPGTDTIVKGSGKREFTEKIMKLILNPVKDYL